jgi:ABC-type multidrug transport system ATPase subunit
MQITLENIGKKFNRRWVFKGLNYTFFSGSNFALLGSNGSGKSTLLQILSGHNSPSTGSIAYSSAERIINIENIYRDITLCAPYLDFPEELTFREILNFHSKFKQPLKNIDEILSISGLQRDADKNLSYFSSGMKQRVKLSMAIFFKSDIILLDEPCSHLDADSRLWFKTIIATLSPERLLIIASNDPDEYSMCGAFLNVEDFK